MTLEFPHSEWPPGSRMFSRPAWAAMRRCAELKPSPANGMRHAVMQPASLSRVMRSPHPTPRGVDCRNGLLNPQPRVALAGWLALYPLNRTILSHSCVQRLPAPTLTWTAGTASTLPSPPTAGFKTWGLPGGCPGGLLCTLSAYPPSVYPPLRSRERFACSLPIHRLPGKDGPGGHRPTHLPTSVGSSRHQRWLPTASSPDARCSSTAERRVASGRPLAWTPSVWLPGWLGRR